MKGYGALLRLTILNRLAALRSGSWKKENGKINWGMLAAVIGIVLFGAVMLAMVIGLEWLMYTVLSTVNHPELLPALALLVGMVGMVMMSFFYVLSSLYFSRDSMWMAYLPVKSSTVLCAKLTEIWAGEAVINAVIMLPAFVMYGIFLKAGAMFYVRAVVIALLSPVLPIAIITLLSTVLARLVGGIRNSTLLTTVLSFGMVILILGFEYLVMLPSMPDDGDSVAQTMWLINLLVGEDALLQTVTNAFPPILWAVEALRSDWLKLLLFAAISMGSIALVVALMGRAYLGLCMKQTEHATGKRRVKLTDASWQAKKPLSALFQLEMREIFRSSVNVTQCLSGGVVFPLIIGIMLMGGSFSEDFAQIRAGVEKLLDMAAMTDVALGLAAVFGFVTFISPAAVTAVSREGGRHALCRMLPVAPKTLLNAKLLCGLVLDAIMVAVTVAVLCAAIHWNPVAMVLALLLTVALAYASTAFMLTVDTIHPVLNWTTETQTIKQNVNVFYGMLVCIVLLALPVVVAVLLAGSSAMARFAAVTAVVLAEAGLGYAAMRCVAVKKYAALEP